MLIVLKNRTLFKLIHLLIFFYYIYANVLDAHTIIVGTCMVLRHSYNDSSYFKKRRFLMAIVPTDAIWQKAKRDDCVTDKNIGFRCSVSFI